MILPVVKLPPAHTRYEPTAYTQSARTPDCGCNALQASSETKKCAKGCVFVFFIYFFTNVNLFFKITRCFCVFSVQSIIGFIQQKVASFIWIARQTFPGSLPFKQMCNQRFTITQGIVQAYTINSGVCFNSKKCQIVLPFVRVTFSFILLLQSRQACIMGGKVRPR